MVMSIEETAMKILKQYGGDDSGDGFNLDNLADTMARWTNFSFAESKKVLEMLHKRNNSNENSDQTAGSDSIEI